MTSTCSTCIYCVSDLTKLGQGFCHKLPPTTFLFPGGQMASAFPPVEKSTGWCGGYEPAKMLMAKDDNGSGLPPS